jgi:hypothetical protein
VGLLGAPLIKESMAGRFLFLLILVLISTISAFKLLVAPCSGLYSHEEAFIVLAKAMKDRGHSVGILKTQVGI